ncbi:MAG: chemotaxis protein CheX [Pirellulales bacterium]
MATAVAAPSAALPAQVDPQLLKAVLDSVSNALIMCNAPARCVGVSSVPTRDQGLITGMIGVHGKVSGFITVNLSEKFAIRAVEGLLQDSYGELSSQVIDGAGEITNIIVGGIKSALANTQWGFSHITVPSVIVGTGYQIAYSRGLEFLCVTFEHQNEEFLMLSDRLLQVSVSMLRL